jgi:hypothetical protein
MILIVKLLALFFGGIAISKTFLDYKKKQESLIMFLFWSLTWLAVIIISFRPLLIDFIAGKIGGRNGGTTTFIGMALIFILYVLYRVYQKSNRIELQLREMTTKLGLKDISKK